jgi:antitoxin component YwqK of YwqJK toxin-antitoxin module
VRTTSGTLAAAGFTTYNVFFNFNSLDCLQIQSLHSPFKIFKMNTRILKSTLYIAISSLVLLASCKQKNGNKSTSELDSNKTQYALHAGLQDGLQNEKYPNGNKKFEGSMKDGKRTGEWFMYFENGTIWSRCNYVNDKKQGKSVVYLPSGAKAYEGMYELDEPIGEWVYYNQDGSIAKKVVRK